jgi:hypothetical protein
MTIWNILRQFGIIYGRLVLFVVIWYIFPVWLCLEKENSGNPEWAPLLKELTVIAIMKYGSTEINVPKFFFHFRPKRFQVGRKSSVPLSHM